MQRYAKYPNLYSYYSLHRHYISSHVIWSDYHIVIVFHSVSWCFYHRNHRNHRNHSAACPRWPCRSSPGPRPPRPRSVAAWSPRGRSLCTSMCTSKHGAAEIQNTKHVTSPKVQQIPTDSYRSYRFWSDLNLRYLRNGETIDFVMNSNMNLFVFAEQPGLICTQLRTFHRGSASLVHRPGACCGHSQAHMGCQSRPLTTLRTWSSCKPCGPCGHRGNWSSSAHGAHGAHGRSDQGWDVHLCQFIAPLCCSMAAEHANAKHLSLSPWSATCHELSWTVMNCRELSWSAKCFCLNIIQHP